MAAQPLETLFVRYLDRQDLTALAQVFDRTAPQLLALARRLAGEEAEDLLQETYLTAIQKAGTWDRSKLVVPWLMGILTHRAQRHWVKQGRAIDEDRLHTREVERPEEVLAATELYEQVEKVIGGMTPALQQAIRASLFEGRTPTQLGVDLGLESGTIRQRLHRAMGQLRLQLKGALLVLLAFFGFRSRGLAAVRRVVLKDAASTSGMGATGLAVMSLPGRIALGTGLVLLCWVGVESLWFAGGEKLEGGGESRLVGLSPDDETESPGEVHLALAEDSGIRKSTAKPLEFKVQLVWDETDEPVAGREVSLVKKSGKASKQPSGENGLVVFPHSLGDPPWRLTVESVQEGLGASDFLGKADPAVLRVVRLSQGGSLSGRVEDSDGNQVAHAVVLGWSGVGTGDGPDRRVEADAEGRFTVQHLGKRFKLTASAPGLVCHLGLHGTVPAGKALTGHRIELKAPVEYVGRVLLPGREPAVGVEVHSADGSGSFGGWGRTHDETIEPFLAGSAEAITDSKGRFVMDGLAPGIRPVGVKHAPYLVYRDTNASHEEPIEIVLDAGESLEGTVRGSKGEIVEGVRVGYWPHHKGTATTRQWHEADPETGAFAIGGISHYVGFDQKPSDVNRGIAFQAQGYAVHVITPIPDDLSELSPLHVTLNPEKRIGGRVIDSSGQPAVGYRVRVEGDRLYESNWNDGFAHTWEKLIQKHITTTDQDGFFSFGELYSGEFKVRVYFGPGEQGSMVQRTISGGEPLEFVIDKESMRGVVILPTVTDELTSEPIKDFTFIQWVGDTGHHRVATEGSRGAEVAGLDSGDWGLGISADGYVSTRQPVKHWKRGEYPVSIELCPRRSFEVRALMPDGTEAGYVKVNANDTNGERLMFHTSQGHLSSSYRLNSTVKHLHGLPARPVELSFESGRFSASVSIDLAKEVPEPLVVYLRVEGPEPVWEYISVLELVPFKSEDGVPPRPLDQPMAMNQLSTEEAMVIFNGQKGSWFREPQHPFSVSVDGPAGRGILTIDYEFLAEDDPELVEWRNKQKAHEKTLLEVLPGDLQDALPRDLSGGQFRLTARSVDRVGWSSAVSYPYAKGPVGDGDVPVRSLDASFETVPGECRLRLTSEFYGPIEFTWFPGQRKSGDPIPLLLLVPK